ncbi:hypothetical protein [Liquorilactobacillus satsumensis]|nr:hypothetical protein [Liquorilactobacillus satsumensis]
MRTELKEGVALTVIPTKQFKTTRITINLITALTATKQLSDCCWEHF